MESGNQKAETRTMHGPLQGELVEHHLAAVIRSASRFLDAACAEVT
jgi:hypothetical protein